MDVKEKVPLICWSILHVEQIVTVFREMTSQMLMCLLKIPVVPPNGLWLSWCVAAFGGTFARWLRLRALLSF
jgi:hypothetical protein